MKCQTVDKLEQYVDEQLTEQENMSIQNHLQDCEHCTKIVDEISEEQQFIKETLLTPALPDDFASTILDQLEPYEEEVVYSKNRNRWKRLMISAAAIVVVVGLSATLNPSFAQWIGGVFTTEQVDDGLRMASKAGFTERVDLKVTDQDVTFKVEDVVADSSRVALSYQILNKNGKPQDSYIDFDGLDNEILAFDQDGKVIQSLGIGWQEGSDYGLIEISLREQKALEEVTVKFDLVELDGKEGKWELEVPVNIKKSLQATTILSLEDEKSSSHGVSINMKEVRFAPSSNELMYETSFTKEEQGEVEKDIQALEQKLGKDSIPSLAKYGTAIQYHIMNEEKKALYHHNTFFEGKGHTSDAGILQGSGLDTDQLGKVTWNESFIPQENENNLTLVLDGVIKTVPSDFSVKIKPQDLKKYPVSFEYEGNYVTIKKAKMQNEYSLRKSLLPIDIERVFKIEMEGGKEAQSTDLGEWVLVDDKGKVYETFGGGSILNETDENGRYKTTKDLIAYDMEEIPEELTLHLVSVTRYYEVDEEWEVPLYKN